MGILNECMNRDVQVWTIKDNYRLGSDINSKVLAFAFGLSAEIERNLISQRTKEALARKRSEGVILGRPKGSRNQKPVRQKSFPIGNSENFRCTQAYSGGICERKLVNENVDASSIKE